ELFKVANTPAAMVALGEEGLIPYIRTIGLFRNKAKAIVAMSRRLLEQHGGQVPADRAALEDLPGVGRKTASVVLNSAFGRPTIAVDTHVVRGPQPHKPGRRPGPGGGGARPGGAGAKKTRPPRPSLADPARPLRVHGAP